MNISIEEIGVIIATCALLVSAYALFNSTRTNKRQKKIESIKEWYDLLSQLNDKKRHIEKLLKTHDEDILGHNFLIECTLRRNRETISEFKYLIDSLEDDDKISVSELEELQLQCKSLSLAFQEDLDALREMINDTKNLKKRISNIHSLITFIDKNSEIPKEEAVRLKEELKKGLEEINKSAIDEVERLYNEETRS